jgi:hypothetical protein
MNEKEIMRCNWRLVKIDDHGFVYKKRLPLAVLG